MLTREECQQVWKKTNGKVCWLENAAANDKRLCLWTEDGLTHVWMNAEWDQEEQAQAARLCANINDEWRVKQRELASASA